MYDLSIVTDHLQKQLRDAISGSPMFAATSGPSFSYAVTCQHPQLPSAGTDTELNLYLFHVELDRQMRNEFWSYASINRQTGLPQQPIAFEPLALDVYFLLSAQSATSYVYEQQLMSVAMRTFHAAPVQRLPTPTPPLPPTPAQPTTEITITPVPTTADELSRIWQSLNAPMRMTMQYKASVVFITTEDTVGTAPNTSAFTLVAAPGDAGDGVHPTLDSTFRRVSYTAPEGPSTYDLAPATAAAAPTGVGGQEFALRGTHILDSDPIYLLSTSSSGALVEQDVTAWKVPRTHPYPATPEKGVALVLRVPDVASPPPGRYELCVGHTGEPAWRSNTVPFSIAPWLDPTGGPLVALDASGRCTCTARHVPTAGASLRLGSVAMHRVTAPAPAPGEWTIVGSTLVLAPPTGLRAGEYPVRFRVDDVDSDPALWVSVP